MTLRSFAAASSRLVRLAPFPREVRSAKRLERLEDFRRPRASPLSRHCLGLPLGFQHEFPCPIFCGRNVTNLATTHVGLARLAFFSDLSVSVERLDRLATSVGYQLTYEIRSLWCA